MCAFIKFISQVGANFMITTLIIRIIKLVIRFGYSFIMRCAPAHPLYSPRISIVWFVNERFNLFKLNFRSLFIEFNYFDLLKEKKEIFFCTCYPCNVAKHT